MKVFFAGKPLKRCPIVFCVMEEEKPEDPNKVCAEKVVVLGPGLTSAFCNEEAEFIVDGSTAGPGKSHPHLPLGLKMSLNHLDLRLFVVLS